MSDATWQGDEGADPLHAYSGYDDIFILKLNASGGYQWHTFYGSASFEEGRGIALDGSGSVYVTGYSGATWQGDEGADPLHDYSGGYAHDIFILKLNASGGYQWHTYYGSTTYDEGYGIAVDGSGNLYVTGWSRATWQGYGGASPLHAHSGGWDIFILKLNASGVYQWHTFYGPYVNDGGNGIAVDGRGNVYVTGRSNATWHGDGNADPLHPYSGSRDIFVLKLNASGTYQWHTFYGSYVNDGGNGIAVDGSGNVYVTGESYATWQGYGNTNPLHPHSGGWDIFILKLNASGVYQWHTFYGSAFYDGGYGIAVDGSGNVYVTGESDRTWQGDGGADPLYAYSGYDDIFILKLGQPQQPVFALPVPAGQDVFNYTPVETPVENPDPALCKPFGVGDLAGGTLSLRVGLPMFSANVDIYLGYSMPEIDPDNIYLITPTDIQPLSAGLTPWKKDTGGDIDESLFGDIPISGLPSGTYYLYVLATPAGNLDTNYLWVTYFVVP